jgi:MFS family permease
MQSYMQDRRIARQVKRDLEKINLERTQQDEKKNERIWVVADDDDPLNPLNWSLISRAKAIAILSLLIFTQAWAGAADSVANSAASQEFGVSKVAENLSTAMYLFGIASGSLFVGPISETVGRNPTYLVATFCYLFFVLGSALSKSFGGFIVCRYLVGLFASATLAINGSSVRDMFRPVKRAFVFPVIAWANVAGECRCSMGAFWRGLTC